MAASGLALARLHEHWTYDRLAREADTIVIASPIAVRDTGERTAFPNVVAVDTNHVRSPLGAVRIETTFTNLAVLKGDTNQVRFVLHHLRAADSRPQLNGPGTVAFDPKGQKRFLLFLKREADGRFAPLTGQTDADGSVRDLGTYP
jgi:hypothetical protein